MADPTLVGKAGFGFVSRYQPGTSAPDGNTQFRFHAGDLGFKSTEYEWLVVAGARGMFKGSGTINGEGGYGFVLSAIDAEMLEAIASVPATEGAPVVAWRGATGHCALASEVGEVVLAVEALDSGRLPGTQPTP